MKNAFIIFLVFIFLFHLIGYKIVFLGLQYQASMSMEQRLQKDSYPATQRVVFKIPITLPYQIYAKGYQKVKGTFKHEGKFYHLVKQKIEGDTLYVVCLKDPYKAALYATMTNFEKAVHNWPLASAKTVNLLQVYIKDFLSTGPTTFFATIGWTRDILFFQVVPRIVERYSCPLLPPPK